MKIYIYTLSCPITNDIKYIGKTNNIRLRYNQHVSDTRKINKVKSWIKSLKTKGISPVMEVIDVCNERDWRWLESYWICQVKSWGFDLKNQINGGIGVTYHSKETRLKISEALKGRCLSREAKSKISKKVYQYDLMGNYIRSFDSESEALISVGIKMGIASSIKRSQSAGGYQWRYHNDNVNIGMYVKRRGNNENSGKQKHKIHEIDKNGKIINSFISIAEAQRVTGLKNISNVCNSIRKHTNNRFFKKAIDINHLQDLK